jgi:hypothetical protein
MEHGWTGDVVNGETPRSRARRHELNTLMLTMADAEDLATTGNAADGYTALSTGLARVLEAQEDGEPWAAEIAGRWREARELFAELHENSTDTLIDAALAATVRRR